MIGTIHTGFRGKGSDEVCCTLPCLVYNTGISLIVLMINIDSNISITINTNTAKNKVKVLSAPIIELYKLVTMPLTIFANIIILVPLPIHFSVINSDNRIISILPNDNTIAVDITLGKK
jgi:hypothetical protein